jgi:hypothetical protein
MKEFNRDSQLKYPTTHDNPEGLIVVQPGSQITDLLIG